MRNTRVSSTTSSPRDPHSSPSPLLISPPLPSPHLPSLPIHSPPLLTSHPEPHLDWDHSWPRCADGLALHCTSGTAQLEHSHSWREAHLVQGRIWDGPHLDYCQDRTISHLDWDHSWPRCSEGDRCSDVRMDWHRTSHLDHSCLRPHLSISSSVLSRCVTDPDLQGAPVSGATGSPSPMPGGQSSQVTRHRANI